MKQGQPVLGQRDIGAVVVRFASTQPELGALSAEQVPAVLRRERNDDLGGHRHCLLGIVGQQGQQRFGQACQVPARDVGLVAEGVASLVVDGTEHCGGVVGLHEGARPVIDRLARYRHVVGVHHAMDETHVHPLRDQGRLTLGHGLQQRQEGLRCGCECVVVPRDRVLGEFPQTFHVTARGKELEGPDSDVARRHARQHCAGQCVFAVDRLARRCDREGAGGGDAQRVHGLADQHLAKHRPDGGLAVAPAGERRAA